MTDQLDWNQIEACLNQKTSEWKDREDNLQKLIDRLNNNDMQVFEFVVRNSKAIALQLNDLRSALVKLASVVVEKTASLANQMKISSFEKFSDNFLKDTNLIKALGSANKVINIHAATAFKSLFEFNQVSYNTLENFYNANKDSKNINVRERIAESLSIYINNLINCKEKKVKIEGIVFLSKAVDSLSRDANGNVRNFAKKAKTVLDKIDDAVKLGGHNSYSMEEELFETKTMSRSRDLQKTKNTINLSNEKVKTIPIQRREPSRGMEIENDDTQPSKYFENSSAKKDLRKPKVKNESIIEILENPKKQMKEKIDQIQKMNLDEFYASCDCDNYKKLLAQFLNAKNFELKKLFVKLIEGVKISKFMGSILNYTEKEALDKKLNYSFFITRLLQEELIEFIEFFLFRNNAFSLKLLQRRFDLEEFDSVISDNPDIVHSLLTIINQNITKTAAESYVKMNSSLLENVYQSAQIINNHNAYPFSDEFYDRLEEVNPELNKFLSNQNRKLGERIVFKPNKNNIKVETPIMKSQTNISTFKQQNTKPEKDSANLVPIFQKENSLANMEEPNENKDSSDNKLEALMCKANPQTKKTVIKSILIHLKNIQANNEPFSIEKLFTKTLEIIKSTLETEDIDEELVNLTFKLIEEIYKISEKDQIKTMTLFDMIFDWMNIHTNYKDKICELIVTSCMRNKFFTHVIMFVDSRVNDNILNGLKTLISMLKVGKESFSFIAFHKEVVSLLSDITKVIKELFVHSEVTIRKTVVHFIVQCHFFLDEKVFPKMLNEFSLDQQKLVEIYIKKSDS